MKKALSLLLTVTMLASLCTVGAWAEDETMDLPVIEEITEEELIEEVELFGEVEMMAEGDIVDVTTSDDDGMTLLSEMDGVSVTAQKNGTHNHEGAIESLSNGYLTVGDTLGGSFITNGETGTKEGFMVYKGDSITIDFGEKKAFSGIRLWDSSRTRYFGTYGTEGTGANPRPGARRITESRIAFSDDGENWYQVALTTAVYNEDGLYSDLPFSFNSNLSKTAGADNHIENGGVMNINARYIRFFATSVTTGWGELEMEEIAMLDADETLKTWSLDGNELSHSIIESVTAGTQWNTTNYAITNAWDNLLSLTSYWHSDPGTDSDEARSFTITLKEKTEIGGVRLWPRNNRTSASPYQSTASMRKVRLMGSDNGTDWYNITTVTNDLSGTYSAGGYSMPVDIIIPGNIDSNVKYLKVVGEKVDAYVCLAEFQLLSPAVKSSVSAYATDDDVVAWKTTPVELTYYSSLGKPRNTGSSVFDGQVHQAINKGEGYYCIWPTLNNDPHWEIDNAMADNGYVTIDFDLGKSYTFSAARLFSRWNQPGQALTKGYVLISDDGVNWYKSDLHQDSGTTVGIDITGAQLARVNLAKYASTGEIYTDMPTSFGEDYNVTARYIRIHCAATSGNHWSFQELMLVKPDNSIATKTVAEIGAILAAEAEEVEEIINALGASPAMEDINEARNAYEALPEGAKELVSEDIYTKLIAAEALVKGSTYEMAVADSTGLNNATFTLPVRDNMEIKSVKYTDTLGREIDGTDATTVTNDGTSMTITMAGEYVTDTGLTAYSDGSKGTLYFATANALYGWAAGQKIEPSFFTGSFVRKVTADGIGDHYITITFGDDTTAVVNIKTTADWIQLSSAAAIEGGEYTDEITPKTTWRSTASAKNRDFNSAFDGKVEYLLRKEGNNSVNRYESDYVAGAQTGNADLTNPSTQVLLYPPVRLDFVIDTGEKTSVSGVRIYPRVASYNADKTKGSAAGAPTEITYWGSDDGASWTRIGSYTFTTSLKEKTALFDSVASYRYYKGSVTKSSGYEYKQTISISEITFLKPQTVLAGTDKVTVDTAASTAAEFTFALVADETVTSVKEGTNDAVYSFANGVLSLDEDYIASLADGEYAFVVTFSNGQSFTLTVVKTNTSSVSYLLYGASGGSGNLVLANPAAKAVKTLKFADGTELPFTLSADNSTITVVRQLFRRSTDLFALLEVNEGGEVTLIATFEDETTKTYTVTIDAEWTAVTDITGEFAEDEIVPGAWKARVSSGQNVDQPGNTLTKAPVGKKDQQNWHTFFGSVEGTVYGDSTAAQGHYFEVDFGENPAPYTGIRHLERPGGTTWNVNVTVFGKNNAADEWTEIYNDKPVYTQVGTYEYNNNGTPAAVAVRQGEILFGTAVSYRYVRIHIKSSSEHITADTIHFIKDKITFNGPEEVIIDKDNPTAAEFDFHVPVDAEGALTLYIDDVEAEGADYTWDKETGVLTVVLDCIKALDVRKHNVEINIDGVSFDAVINVKNLYTADYYLASNAPGIRGTDALSLFIPEGKTVSTLKYGDKDVAFKTADGNIVVERYIFRDLDDFWYLDEVVLTAVFTDNTTQDYEITLYKGTYEIAEGNAAIFEADEIVSKNEWTATAISMNSDMNGVAPLFSKTGGYWHSAYSEDRSDPDNVKAVADSTAGRHYIQLSVPAGGVEFSGIRYYCRTDNLAGTWDGVAVYVRSEGGDWRLVKSQSFNKESLTETRIATVYFDEAVQANDILFVIDAEFYKYATAKAITLLKPGTKTPDAEEGKVKVNVTPTTGGNVYVNGTPSLGDSYIGVNDEVTLTADEAGFKYWLDANTGKILGSETTLTLTTSVSRDIKAVFADPIITEAFVSFIGRNSASVISSGYVRKGEKAQAPSEKQLYQTGYTFTKWVDKDGADLDVDAVINANTDFYAVYVANDTIGTVRVTNGTVSLADGTDEAAAEKTYAYNTKVKAVANAAPADERFAYWTLNGEIVCYTRAYIFFVPDMDAELVANYVAKDSDVEQAVNITLDVTTTTVDDTLVASFLTTRVVPSDVTVIETGVIYVKDGNAGELTVDKVGTVTANGKKIKVSLSSGVASGQYKLTASYTEDNGISARGFITYLDGDTVKTVYTDVYTI